MNTILWLRLIAVIAAAAMTTGTRAQQADPRLREVTYDAHAVVSVPVKNGVVTHIVL